VERELTIITDSQQLREEGLDLQRRVPETQLASHADLQDTLALDSQERVPEMQLASQNMLNSESELTIMDMPFDGQTAQSPLTPRTTWSPVPTPTYHQVRNVTQVLNQMPNTPLRLRARQESSKTASNAKANQKISGPSELSTPSVCKHKGLLLDINTLAKKRAQARQPLAEVDSNISGNSVVEVRSSRYSGRVITPSKWRAR
jgi:hypothetical protein